MTEKKDTATNSEICCYIDSDTEGKECINIDKEDAKDMKTNQKKLEAGTYRPYFTTKYVNVRTFTCGDERTKTFALSVFVALLVF